MPDDDGKPTQEDVDKLKRALEAERAKGREQSAELAKLRTDLDAAVTAAKGKGKGDAGANEELVAKVEKLEQELGSTKGELNEERLNRIRLEVGAAKGLTPKQALRLKGSTREELEADADDEEAFPRRTADKGKGGEGEGGDDDPQDPGGEPIRRKADSGERTPRESLKGGGKPDEEPVETDPRVLAEAFPRM